MNGRKHKEGKEDRTTPIKRARKIHKSKDTENEDATGKIKVGRHHVYHKKYKRKASPG